MPNATGVILHAKQLPNHLRDPRQRPVVFRIALGTGTLQQDPFQTFQLSNRQVTGPSRMRGVRFSLWVAPARRLSPAVNTAGAGTDGLGYFGWAFASPY